MPNDPAANEALPDDERAEEDLEEAEPTDVDRLAARAGLALMAGLGLVLGGLAGGGVWSLYPPGRGSTWPMPALVAGSTLVVAVLWVVLGRRLGRRAGDWFLAGFALAIVLLGVFVLGAEAAEMFRVRAFQSFAD
jgi:hypothetical protein